MSVLAHSLCPSFSRRDFLRRTGLIATGAAVASLGQGTSAAESRAAAAVNEEKNGQLVRLTEHLAVYQGPINVGVVLDGKSALLIDCGDARVLETLREQGVTVQRVLFTHHHRDQACGAHRLVEVGAKLSAPAGERGCFADVAAYWKNPKHRWRLYNFHPHHLMLAESVPVEASLSDGQELAWGEAKIRVLATPGHTDGSVSYVVEADGKRVVFSGDVIYDEGRIWDLHSLQKGVGTFDYHGFLGALPELVESLGRINRTKAEWLVPSHGRIVDRPDQAIEALTARLNACYDKYIAISALRHFFPQRFTQYAGRKDHMPHSPTKPLPHFLRHYATTWILISKDKSALVMDCWNPGVIKWIQKLLASGEICRVEGLWITHYHDDHTDGIPEFQKTFDCPCITGRAVADVITDPLAWRIPCISPNKARVDRATADGESWQWHEFRLTAYHLPGQTLYHAGLLAESGDQKMLFTGDSFTPSGIDDYCPHNRTWLGRSVGFDHCLELIERTQPTHLLGAHIDLPWQFTAEQLRFMRTNLAEREKLFGELLPWDHPNFGMDEPWARCHPYEQRATPGEEVAIQVIVTNHSSGARPLACRAVLPQAWGGQSTAWARTEIPSKKDGRVCVALRVPSGAKPGRHVLPIDLHFGRWVLPQFTEAIVVV